MKTKLHITVLIIILGCVSMEVKAQDKGGITMYAEVVNGDTVPVQYLAYHDVVDKKTFRSDYEQRKWNRLKYNVKKVYPYAKLAGDLLKKYEVQLDSCKNDRQKRKYFKLIEKELKAEYEDDLRKMTTTQGHILIKLIDRETGSSSYDIVKEFRGNISAFVWQSLGKLFDQDLKSRYDATGEDKEIENIIVLIETGHI